MMKVEEWRLIEEFPGYAVSTWGRVQNVVTQQMMSRVMNQRGVVYVTLSDDGRHFVRSVPVLAATAFLGEPTPPDDTPIHLDGDRLNCEIENLMWRPRWFAILYHRQFNPPLRKAHTITMPIQNLDTGEEFPSSLDAAIHYGVLERDIVRSVLRTKNCERVPMLGHEFAVIR